MLVNCFIGKMKNDIALVYYKSCESKRLIAFKVLGKNTRGKSFDSHIMSTFSLKCGREIPFDVICHIECNDIHIYVRPYQVLAVWS
jgi:hypothetical protein